MQVQRTFNNVEADQNFQPSKENRAFPEKHYALNLVGEPKLAKLVGLNENSKDFSCC